MNTPTDKATADKITAAVDTIRLNHAAQIEAADNERSDALRNLMQEHNITLRALAATCHVAPSTITRWTTKETRA